MLKYGFLRTPIFQGIKVLENPNSSHNRKNETMASVTALLCLFFAAVASSGPDNIRIYRIKDVVPPTTTTVKPATSTEPLRESPTTEQAVQEGSGEVPKPGYVLTHSPFSCQGLNDGYYVDVHFQCRFFHQCKFFISSDGNKFIQQSVFQCGTGTMFNQTLLTCDYNRNVKCDPELIAQIIEYQMTAPTPPPGFGDPAKFPLTTFRCDFRPGMQGWYHADVDSGCSMYHKCTYHIKLIGPEVYMTQQSFLCPPGTLFDQRTTLCQDATEVTDCKGSLALVRLQAS